MLVLTMAFALMSYFIVLNLMPATYWFKYEKVEPSKEVFAEGEQLFFRSYADFRRGGHVRWNDVLRCDTGHGFGFFSFYNSEANMSPNGGVPENPTPWPFRASTPVPPAECYLESNVTLDLPFGITKTQKIIGPTFEIQ